MKSFTISAIALFTSAVVAQNATAVVDPFATITTLPPFVTCALGPAYMSCDSKLAQRAECNFTEPIASASCSCAYASSRMACNAICTDTQIDLAIDCPKPTSWSVYPGWGSSSSASTTKSGNWTVPPKSYGCSESGYTGTWATTTKPYTGTWGTTTKASSAKSSGSWVYSASGKPSSWVTGPGSWVVGPSGSSSWAYATETSTAATTTPTVVMQTKNDAARPTGVAAAAVMALAGVAGALL